MSSARAALLRCLGDPRGSVMLEYALVLVLIAVGLITALVTAGDLLARLFLYQEALLILPYP